MSIRHFIASAVAVLAASLSFAAAAAVDANRAGPDELQTVKGIGPGLSAKIVAARQQAAFKDWPDLVERVSGVGARNAARYSQAGLTVGGAAFDPAALPKAEPAAGKKPAREKRARKAADAT